MDRRDPVEILVQQARNRTPELVPIRHGRMLRSPFAFFRGAAAIMAADLADTPVSGPRAQLSGDAHLANYGMFAAPDRQRVFDVNDFGRNSKSEYGNLLFVDFASAGFTVDTRAQDFRRELRGSPCGRR
jgi:uncharacterized protein (DUF2252 family)